MTDIYEVTAYHILHTPRSSHDNLRALFEATRLFLDTCTAIYRHYVHLREVLSIIAEFRSDLQAEFACRRKDKTLSYTAISIDKLEERKAKSGCFTSTRLG